VIRQQTQTQPLVQTTIISCFNDAFI
jgi:hypothetical protein